MAKQSAAEETAARSELVQQLLATTDNAARKPIADRPEMQPLLTALQAQERERAAESKKLDDISLLSRATTAKRR